MLQLLVLSFFGGACAYYPRSLNLNFLCTPLDTTMYVRDIPWDCSSYVICLSGQALPATCPLGKLYMSAEINSKCGFTTEVNSTRCEGTIWKFTAGERKKEDIDLNPRPLDERLAATLQQLPKLIINRFCNCAVATPAPQTTSRRSVDTIPKATLPHSGECAHYFDCSVINGASEYMEYLLECPYPSLFSTHTGTCKDYRLVSCGERSEPRTPCEYHHYLQKYNCSDPGCAACDYHHPSCVGLANGNHPVPNMDDVLIACYEQRTMSIIPVPPKKA
ncbi:unnamed protein product, partial [Candidula unifasciata]